MKSTSPPVTDGSEQNLTFIIDQPPADYFTCVTETNVKGIE